MNQNELDAINKMIPIAEELERLLTLRAEVIEQSLRVPMGQITEENEAACAWVAKHGGGQFLRELVVLMREKERLQARIKQALWVEGYYHEGGAEFGDYERGRADGWESARREFHKRLRED